MSSLFFFSSFRKWIQYVFMSINFNIYFKSRLKYILNPCQKVDFIVLPCSSKVKHLPIIFLFKIPLSDCIRMITLFEKNVFMYNNILHWRIAEDFFELNKLFDKVSFHNLTITLPTISGLKCFFPLIKYHIWTAL